MRKLINDCIYDTVDDTVMAYDEGVEWFSFTERYLCKWLYKTAAGNWFLFEEIYVLTLWKRKKGRYLSSQLTPISKAQAYVLFQEMDENLI